MRVFWKIIRDKWKLICQGEREWMCELERERDNDLIIHFLRVEVIYWSTLRFNLVFFHLTFFFELSLLFHHASLIFLNASKKTIKRIFQANALCAASSKSNLLCVLYIHFTHNKCDDDLSNAIKFFINLHKSDEMPVDKRKKSERVNIKKKLLFLIHFFILVIFIITAKK